MEELLAHATPEQRQLYAALSTLLFFGGLYAAFRLARHERLHPPDHRFLTDRIIQRAWDGPTTGLVASALLLLYLLAGFAGRFVAAPWRGTAQIAMAAMVDIAVLALIYRLLRQRGSSWTEGFGIDFQGLEKARFAPLFYLALLPLMALAAQANGWAVKWLTGREPDLQKVAQAIAEGGVWLRAAYSLLAVALAPLFEEILFRGLLFPYLAKRAGIVPGALLVSVLFAALHFHAPSFAPLLLLSAGLCLAYWRTGTLWVPIAMHAIFNAVSVLALQLLA